MKNLLFGGLLGFGFAVFLMFVLLYTPASQHSPEARRETPYSTFMTALDEGKIDWVNFGGSRIFGKYKDGYLFETFTPHPQILIALTDRLLAKNVTVTARAPDDTSASAIFAAWVPFLICYGLFFGGAWLVMARPILALTRQLDAYIKATQRGSAEPPAQA
jgi:ATP-dependent Zn protease